MNMDFVHADATRMELEPNSLDGAICTLGWSAMPEEQAARQQLARAILQPFLLLDTSTLLLS